MSGRTHLRLCTSSPYRLRKYTKQPRKPGLPHTASISHLLAFCGLEWDRNKRSIPWGVWENLEKLALIICPLRTSAPLVTRYLNLERDVRIISLSSKRAEHIKLSIGAASKRLNSSNQVPSTEWEAWQPPISANITSEGRIFRSGRLLG